MTLSVSMGINSGFFSQYTMPPDLFLAVVKPFSGFSVHSEYNLNSFTWPVGPCVIWLPFSLPVWSPGHSVQCSTLWGLYMYSLPRYQLASGALDHVCFQGLATTGIYTKISATVFSPPVKHNVLNYTLFLSSGLLVKLPWTLDKNQFQRL